MSDHPPGAQTWIDRIVTLFDRDWRSSKRPLIETYLAGVAEPRLSQLFEALLRVEMGHLATAGETPIPTLYETRFPDHIDIVRRTFRAEDVLDSIPTSAANGSGRGAGEPSSLEGPSTATAFHQPPTAARAQRAQAGDDLTLTYARGELGGAIEPFISSEGHERLRETFASGVVLQGRYLIEREIRHGGMGRVYLGRDTHFARPVAIKVVLPGGGRGLETAARLQEAFLEAARQGANLMHPAIATVFDFGLHGGAAYTVFEHVPGSMLRDLMTPLGRFLLEDVQTLIGPLAQALDFAHARFVVHRDLKPENIKATENGQFKILDLGMAKDFRHNPNWSGFEGTPAYASPEQAAGVPCDGRTDQYALALIVYEMLVGLRPFTGKDSWTLLRMHRDEAPPDPRRFVVALQDRASLAIKRALSKDPNNRFATCEEFARELGCRFLADLPTPPEILLEAEVWTGRWAPLPWPVNEHVALTQDALLRERDGEVTEWPVAAMRAFQLCRLGTTLQIKFRTEDSHEAELQRLCFGLSGQGKEWYGCLKKLIGSGEGMSDGQTAGGVVGTVITVAERPEIRQQVLGPVEAFGRNRASCEAGLRIRAALIGADAVVDVHTEAKPSSRATPWRTKGIAVKAVDSDGRTTLRLAEADGICRLHTKRMAVTVLALTAADVIYGVFVSLTCHNNIFYSIIFLAHTAVFPLLFLAGVAKWRWPWQLGTASLAVALWGFDRFLFQPVRMSELPGAAFDYVRYFPMATAVLTWVIARRAWVGFERFRRAGSSDPVHRRWPIRGAGWAGVAWSLLFIVSLAVLLSAPAITPVALKYMAGAKLRGIWRVEGVVENGEELDPEVLARPYFSFGQCALAYPDVSGHGQATIRLSDDQGIETKHVKMMSYRFVVIKHNQAYFNALILETSGEENVYFYNFSKDTLKILQIPWRKDVYLMRSPRAAQSSEGEFTSKKGSGRNLYSLSRQSDIP